MRKIALLIIMGFSIFFLFGCEEVRSLAKKYHYQYKESLIKEEQKVEMVQKEDNKPVDEMENAATLDDHWHSKYKTQELSKSQNNTIEEEESANKIPDETRETEESKLSLNTNYSQEELVEKVLGILKEANNYLKGRDVEATPKTESNTVNKRKKNIMDKIKYQSSLLGVDTKLALAVAKVESDFNPRAVSSADAIGIFQVLPSTGRESFGVKRWELFDEDININVGLRHLRRLIRLFGEDLSLALAAYHCGEKRVISSGYQIPDITSTKGYVRKVKKEYHRLLAKAI